MSGNNGNNRMLRALGAPRAAACSACSMHVCMFRNSCKHFKGVVTAYKMKCTSTSAWMHLMAMPISKNATWRWQRAHLVICTCDMHFLRQDLLKSHMETYILDNYVATCNTFRDMNFILVWISFTDRQTDGQKVTPMSPPCNMHRWAKKWSNLTLKWAHLPMTLRLATSQDCLADCNLHMGPPSISKGGLKNTILTQ